MDVRWRGIMAFDLEGVGSGICRRFRWSMSMSPPGSCLLRLLVEEGAKDASVKMLRTWGWATGQYKERFANTMRQTRYVHLSRGLNRHMVSVGRQMLSRAAARFPEFGEKIRGARSLGRALVSRVHENGFVATARQSVRKAVQSEELRTRCFCLRLRTGGLTMRLDNYCR